MRRTAVFLVAAMALVGAGCSSSSSDGGSAPTTTTAVDTTSSTATTPAKPLSDQTSPESINGITVQGDTLWVASIKADEVLQVRIADGAILQRFDTAGAGPDDVAVGPDGSVWSTGFVNGDVGRIKDGNYSVMTNIEAGINPLEFTPDGTLYIGTYGPEGKLYEVPTDGSEASLIAEGLPDINAFGALSDTRLVAPGGGISGPGIAVEVTLDTKGDTTSASWTVRSSKAMPPVAAGATDADGTMYLLANITGEVIELDLDNTDAGVESLPWKVVRTVSKGAPFDNLSFAPDGTLYLSSFVAPTITEVKPDGTTRVIEIGA